MEYSNSSSQKSICRWGVIGTARIARKVVRAMHLSQHANPVAIASRDLDRALAFAEENDLKRTFGSYEELLADPQIDAVYVPVPTGMRRDVVIEAARAGKHVLCEKPVAPNAATAEQMINACRDFGVQFMDGVMFMHHHRLELLRKQIGDLNFDPRLVESAFSFNADAQYLESNIRTSIETEPLGCVGDLGWYCVRMSLILMQDLPCVVRAWHHQMHGGVPIHTTGELVFEGCSGLRLARFQCSYCHPLRQWVEIVGDGGCIRIPDFVIGSPSEAEVEIETESTLNELETLHRRTLERIVVENCIQEAEMIECFSRIAAGIDPIDSQWPRWAIETQRVTDAIMNSAEAGGCNIILAK